MPQRYVFLVSVPGEDQRQEYGTVGDGLTPEEAVERCYDRMSEGAEIVKVARGEIPDDVDLSPPDQGEEDNPNIAETANLELPKSVSDDEQELKEAGEPDDEVDQVAELTDEHWATVTAGISGGELDDLLDEIEEADDRNSVQTAIEERRQELSDNE
jgi:hypothetical protein